MSISFIRSNLILFVIIISFSGRAQEKDFAVFLEPEIAVGIDPDNPWAYSFGVANRNIVYNENKFQVDTRFIELSHFTGYSLNDNQEIGIGIRYRFEESFVENQDNEIRFLQEYENSRSYNYFELSHRFRIEERFREITSFRGRYQLSLEFPLDGSSENQEFTLETATESLWSLGKDELPELAQRISLGLGANLNQTTSASFGVQFRYEDYTHDPETELFIFTGLNLKI